MTSACQVCAAREDLVADLRKAHARHETELGGLVLDEHRHQARHRDDPQEQVAVLGPSLEVGGEVPGVDVRNGGDERRA
jgi:hypothetical protein